MNVTELFEKECAFMKLEHNGIDCLVYPKIDEAFRAEVRVQFGIDNDETILLIRDTSFWNVRNQGMVITDVGFYCIVDNDNPEPFSYGWDCIADVRYHELKLYFRNSQGEDLFWAGMNHFIKESDNQTQIGQKLAVAFTKIAQSVEPVENPIYGIVETYDNLIEQMKYHEAINYCLEWVNYTEYSGYIYDLIARAYLSLQDWNKSIEYAKKSLEIYDERPNDYGKVLSQYTLYSAYDYLGLNNQARKECLSVMLNATTQTAEDDSGLLVKDDATKDFQIYEEVYKKEFLTLPYNERKVIMPVKRYVDLHQEHVAVIDIQNMPAINFPMGHPVANQLYVGHPLIPSKYIPFENYQLELVEDKIREFCTLAQNLGATEIAVECLNSASTDQSNNRQENMNASADVWIAEAKGTMQNNSSQHVLDEISRSVSLHQTFEPHNKPFVPEGLVWYGNEPSWQRLVSQRLNGGLTFHEERIEIKKSQMVEGRELQNIKAEVEYLFAEMNISMDKNEESKFTQQENAVLAIKVKFAPIHQLMNNVSASASAPNFTAQEKGYLAELKEILVDGEISPRERRLLEKIRVQSGISKERAAELERTLTKPQLTAEEQEYLNEYKAIIADGEITEKERRLLDKILKLNGISSKRARELEASVR